MTKTRMAEPSRLAPTTFRAGSGNRQTESQARQLIKEISWTIEKAIA